MESTSRVRAAFLIAAVLYSVAHGAMAQTCPASIYGGWETRLPAAALFEVRIEVDRLGDDEYVARLSSGGDSEQVPVWRDVRSLRLQSARYALSFEGRLSEGGDAIAGFVDFSSNLYRISLAGSGTDRWSAVWRPVPDVGDTIALELFFEDEGDGGTGGYFYFRDDRLPVLYGSGAVCSGPDVEARERNLGLKLAGRITALGARIEATVSGPGGSVRVDFTPLGHEQAATPPAATIPPRAGSDVAPDAAGDDWPTAKPSDAGADPVRLAALADAVERGRYPGAHAILAARSGHLIFEEYFRGFDRSVLHDMRSASKSLASTLVGLAIDRGFIDGVDAPVLAHLPAYRSYANWDPRKAHITVRHLMTMSSGLDANDADGTSAAAEGAYQSQNGQPDWIKFALDAPMVSNPGEHLVYGSANPMILGGVLANTVDDRLEWFAEETLFRPLGIDRYRIFLDPAGTPYLGGGMYLRPRDMLKIGQLYLDGGRWQGTRILPEAWIDESFGKYGRLEPLDRNGNEYGYLWWHESYDIGGVSVASVEARGNGGQYLFVVPAFDVVAVMTSGNYRGGIQRTRQPQRIFQEFLLPALLNRVR